MAFWFGYVSFSFNALVSLCALYPKLCILMPKRLGLNTLIRYLHFS